MNVKILFLVLIVLFGIGVSSAKSNIGVGYNMNFSDQPLGVCLFTPNITLKTGIYFSFKSNCPLTKNPNYTLSDPISEISIFTIENSYNGKLIEKYTTWMSFNFGITKELINNLKCYVAPGISLKREYWHHQIPIRVEVKDENNRLRVDDEWVGIWTKNSSENKFKFNVVIGLIYPINVFALKVGYNTIPGGVTAGILIIL